MRSSASGPSSAGMLLVVTLLLAACVPASRLGPSPFDPQPGIPVGPVNDVPVVVENDHWLPMRVWAEWAGMSRFLGDVPPGAAVTFMIPADLTRDRGALQLRADPTGSSDEVVSEAIDAGRCRRVEWRLRRVLAHSRVRVMGP